MYYFAKETSVFPIRDTKNFLKIPNYFSPDRLEEWVAGDDIPVEDHFKSDVWSLGLVIVQIGNLQKLVLGCNQNKGKLKDQLHHFSQRYKGNMTKVL